MIQLLQLGEPQVPQCRMAATSDLVWICNSIKKFYVPLKLIHYYQRHCPNYYLVLPKHQTELKERSHGGGGIKIICGLNSEVRHNDSRLESQVRLLLGVGGGVSGDRTRIAILNREHAVKKQKGRVL